MPRDYQLYINDIKVSCEKIVRYTQNMSFEKFSHDEIIYDAVLRNLMIIGEAAKSLPDDWKGRFPAVEWKKISGFRDIIAHAYFGIDNAIVWDIVRVKIPALHAALD